ncbi:hypothetical protein M8C13_36325 [Crossiella sp. SN42]|uniref:hypothetical protein n=1 Tax=Crossiella sp. SN42 TaxID=2944808 RepID=UPI00207C5F8D|nr:hypothetical protein [Crossiella sp. SN42]MCO1581231.1 hypothetical protein [Crossiella sp. SN42]
MTMNWQAVAEAVTTRMEELELSQVDLAAAAGVSVAWLRSLQRGHAVRRSEVLLGAVSAQLGWPKGRLMAIATNQATSEEIASSAQIAETLEELRREVAELRRRVKALERAAVSR